jgi:hypothetical protein
MNFGITLLSFSLWIFFLCGLEASPVALTSFMGPISIFFQKTKFLFHLKKLIIFGQLILARTQIRNDLKCWTLIRIETNADPQHWFICTWYIQKRYILADLDSVKSIGPDPQRRQRFTSTSCHKKKAMWKNKGRETCGSLRCLEEICWMRAEDAWLLSGPGPYMLLVESASPNRASQTKPNHTSQEHQTNHFIK